MPSAILIWCRTSRHFASDVEFALKKPFCSGPKRSRFASFGDKAKDPCARHQGFAQAVG